MAYIMATLHHTHGRQHYFLLQMESSGPFQASVSSSQNQSTGIGTEYKPICLSFTNSEISFCGIPLRNIPPRKWKIRCYLKRQIKLGKIDIE